MPMAFALNNPTVRIHTSIKILKELNMQILKKYAGLLCCIAALLIIISCSTHRTSSYKDTRAFYPQIGTQPYFSGDARALGVYAIFLVSLAIIPPTLDAIGELIDAVCIELGLKEKGSGCNQTLLY